MSSPCLSLKDVSRSFGPIEAVRNVGFDVASGECVALVGHNGAGKTTLFKLILGLLKPDSGTIAIDASGMGKPGFLPESVSFHTSLSGREILRTLAKLKRSPGEDIDALLGKVDLLDAGDRKVGTFSKGMRQRLGLAQALIGRPQLLILDEPTTGLDPTARRTFYDLLDDLRGTGTSILLSSHALAEVEAHITSIAMMRKGVLVARGSVSGLAEAANLPMRIDVSITGNDCTGAIEALKNICTDVRQISGGLSFECKREQHMQALTLLSNYGNNIASVQVVPPALSDVYNYFHGGNQER